MWLLFGAAYILVIFIAFVIRLVDLGIITSTITTRVPYTPRASDAYEQNNLVFETTADRDDAYALDFGEGNGPFDIEIFMTYMEAGG